MRQTYILKETAELSGILDETYEEISAALKHRNPGAKSLVEDDELSQLHDLLALLRLGHIKVGYAEDETERLIILEVNA
jgi:hypothetical protein